MRINAPAVISAFSSESSDDPGETSAISTSPRTKRFSQSRPHDGPVM